MRSSQLWCSPSSGPANICYTARITGGQLVISDESTEIRFVDPDELDSLPMHHTQRLRIGHYVEKRDSPYLG